MGRHFLWTLMGCRGVSKAKKLRIFLFSKFFFMGNAGPFKSNAENLRKIKIIRYDMGRSVVSRYKNLVRGCDKRCYVSTFGLLHKKGNTTFWNLSKPHLLEIFLRSHYCAVLKIQLMNLTLVVGFKT